MKTNVTLKLEKELVREAKVLAARRGTSVSRMMAEQLALLVRQDQRYESASRRALRRLQEGYDLNWVKSASRDELHDRQGLR